MDALERSDVLGVGATELEVLQTRRSVLIFAADRVYSLRRQHRGGGSEAGRAPDSDILRRMCEERARLERRGAPGVVLGAVPITREADGYLALAGRGAAVQWVLETRRLPRSARLDERLVTPHADAAVGRVASALVRYHQRAHTGPDINRWALPDGIVSRVHAALDELEGHGAAGRPVASRAALAHLRAHVDRRLGQHLSLLVRRIADWRIRDGHGDLRASSIGLDAEGVHLLGCLEGERRRRSGDIAWDLAGLVVDLDHRGFAWASEELVESYSRLAGDGDLAELVGLYRELRALERAAQELAWPDADERALEEARSLVQLALGYGAPPSLVVVQGSGADEALQHLARRLRATTLRAAELEAGGEGRERVGAALGADVSVVLDARGLDEPRLERAVRPATQLASRTRRVVLDGEATPENGDARGFATVCRTALERVVGILPEPSGDSPGRG